MNTPESRGRGTALLLCTLLAVACVTAGLRAQCPIDYGVYFPDKPDDLAPGNNVVYGAYDVPAITLFDPDGTGTQAPMFIAAIHYVGPADCAGSVTISSEWTRIDRWDNATNSWVPMTPRFDGVVTSFEAFDEDQSGPNPPRLYIGGRFSGWSGIASPNIMRYDGTSFSAVRSGLNGTVWCMHVHDDDGAGATLPKLYVGGEFNAAPASGVQGQVNCSRLIRLTGGQRWEDPSSGFNDAVFALASFDEDGPGVGVAKLAVGGAFTANGGQNHRLISLFDGTAWTTLGTGLDPVESWPTPVRRVFSLCEFDEDGTGPHLPSLFAGGSIIRTPEGTLSPLVVQWRKNYATGNAGWLSVPLPAGIITDSAGSSCLNFCSTFPYEPSRDRVTCMMPFDTDGSGAGATELFIGGIFRSNSYANTLMRWNPVSNTTSWVIGAGGAGYGNSPSPWSVDGAKHPLAMITVPASPSVPARLLIAGGRISRYVPWHPAVETSQGCSFLWNGELELSTSILCNPIVSWGLGGSGPGVSNQPDNTWVTLTDSTSGGFSVTPSGTGPFTYRWRKDAIELVNGSSQGYGGIIGATGPAAIIGGTANPVTLAAQGWYDVRVSNTCGTGYSLPAWMVVQPDAAPYFPIRIDAPVAPVVTAIGNASFDSLYGSASAPEFFTVLEGVPFAIAPTGNALWRSRFVAGSATGNKSITIPIARYGVGQVYTLMNTESGSTSESVLLTFTASGGRTWSTRLWGGNQIRSFLTLGGVQTVSSSDTVPVRNNTGSRLDRQRILLPNDFRTRTLTSITITDEGTDTTLRVFLGGLTLQVRPQACGPADLGSTGGQLGADGILDNNDFVLFIDMFFNSNPAADVGRTGGIPGLDGVFDNNDFIVFIDQFFAGC